TFDGLAYRGRLADPQAKLVARLYTDYLQRLTDPFLLVVQVASPDHMAVRAVAQTVGTEITETTGIAEATQEGTRLPTGFDLVTPESMSDLGAACHTLRTLQLFPWGKSEASPGKERLRYLVDARTASAAFRFPVPIRGGVPGVRTRQAMPTYDVGPRKTHAGPDELLIGTFSDRGGVATVPLAYLNRHALVAGTTGSGKTTTCLGLLLQLWGKGIPFLVIEPAKAEYRSLLDALGDDLLIFTLGDESASPFRLNPLEILTGVRVETHLSAVAAAINAAIPTFGVLPTLIEQALERLYLDKGWDLVDRARSDEQRLYPTLGELYHEIIQVAEERGYSDRTMQDVRGAAAGRIGSLLRGSKGRTLNTLRTIPMDELIGRPVILELQSLTDEEKALVMMFLLTMIYEYCQVHRESARLQHVTVVEEAHRVMTAVLHRADRETTSDVRAEAVGLFTSLLSEMRAYGEGLIIAEQIPVRLAQDALKNTNIKIVHRLPGEDDRNAIGATMRMDDRQREHVAGLTPSRGEAAFFADGLEKPTFIEVPNVRRERGLPERVSDARVEAHTQAFREAYSDLYLPFPGCRHCHEQCLYRDRVGSLAHDIGTHKAFRKALYTFEQHLRAGDEGAGWAALAAECRDVLARAGLALNPHAAYCYFVHLYGRSVTSNAAQQLRNAIRS
ncbi:MAG: ATP-binding protein, partial [Promethearchaeota archaeon]